MHQVQLVLFDLDGTLADTSGSFDLILNCMRRDLGKADLPAGFSRNWVGEGADSMVKHGLESTSDNHNDYKQNFLDKYHQDPVTGTTCFEGIVELVSKLTRKEILWGIATNKPEKFATPLIRNLFEGQLPNVTICGDEIENPKPHPQMLLECCKRLELNPQNSVYLGDHARDIDAAKAAGFHKALACEWGYITEASPISQWQADGILRHPDDLMQYL